MVTPAFEYCVDFKINATLFKMAFLIWKKSLRNFVLLFNFKMVLGQKCLPFSIMATGFSEIIALLLSNNTKYWTKIKKYFLIPGNYHSTFTSDTLHIFYIPTLKAARELFRTCQEVRAQREWMSNTLQPLLCLFRKKRSEEKANLKAGSSLLI